jgi:predicted patatin/cPLA2 family phospholipase
MEYEGNTSLPRLLEGTGRLGLLILGGGTRGVYGSAAACVLEERGLRDRFSVLAGVSSGAGPILYFSAEEVRRGTPIYYEECTTPHFLSLSPRRFMKGTAQDIKWLGEVFRGTVGSKGVSIEKVRAASMPVLVGVTNVATHSGELIDIRTLHDPVAGVIASMAMPYLCRQRIVIDGNRYRDGSINTLPFPAENLVQAYNLDGLLVFANRPRRSMQSWQRRALEVATRTRDPKTFDRNLSFLRSGSVRYGIIWTDESISIIEQNADRLRHAAHTAHTHMTTLLQG